MRGRWLKVAAMLVATAAGAAPRHDAEGIIVLEGVRTAVRWTDGDSFKVKEGRFAGRATRLQGYNTLEAFGPVHAWGAWTPAELFALASDSARVAASEAWACTTDGREDGYHRLLMRCPQLTVFIVAQGHGMAYAVEGERPEPEVLAAQREAMAARRGMWRKGVVKGVVSSVHALGEADAIDRTVAYNRVVDTRTGEARRRPHQHRYATCETVCEDTEGDRSCMVYVPFERRYRNRPRCLTAVPLPGDGAKGAGGLELPPP
jgi:endonuclease YncB( thermonuclease family)